MNFKLLAFALAIGAANVQAITLAEAKSVLGSRILVAKQKSGEAYVAFQEKLSKAVQSLKDNKKKSIAAVLSPAALAVLVKGLKDYQHKNTNLNVNANAPKTLAEIFKVGLVAAGGPRSIADID